MNEIRTIIEEVKDEIIEKKSRFIGYFFPCDSALSFEKRLQEIKKEHPQARHHCYAYRIKEQIVNERYSDDREPAKTAGFPILEVLKGKELLNCAIVVVRYFGGTLLGTGGLSRAYSEASVAAVSKAQIVLQEEALCFWIRMEYSLLNKLDYFIEKEELAVQEKKYDEHVHYELILKKESSEMYLEKLKDLMNGQVEIEENGKKIIFSKTY
ncbi:MAG: YigZ family protein [Vallitaleaceae bacterium]|nr:YigZ family protein [Vallitaleaceae bacterium]